MPLFENTSTADRRDGDDGTVSTRNQGDDVKPSTERPRTAAVTGAGSGLGREIALKLAAKGYQVFGGLAVINAFLPALRRSRGRIVAIGAMTGRFPLPFNGPSSSSKAALEAIADIYRSELKPFGVQFVLVQAGNMVTGGP